MSIFSRHISRRLTQTLSMVLVVIVFASAMPHIGAAATKAKPAAKPASVTGFPEGVSVSRAAVTEQNDFVLEPGKFEVFANPGDTVVKNIIVTNRINRTVQFKVESEDFIGSRDVDRPVVLLGDDTSPYSFKDNLKPAIKTFSLGFGERIVIPVTVEVPKTAQPGGFYSSILISNEPDQDAALLNTSAAVAKNRIISRLGVLFFVRVNGDAKESGNVEDFRVTASPDFIRQKGPTTFEVLFNNTGNIHLIPYGTIEITNLFGQKVAALPVDAYFSLPNSLRYRSVTWDKEYLLGRYKATLHLNRGYGNIVETKVLSFWVIPWKVLLAIFGVIVVLSGIGYFIGTRFEFKRKK